VTRAYLGLGSNLGDRLAHLQRAVDALAAVDGIDVLAVSQVYETAPVGGPEQDDFLNAVVAVETMLDPFALLAAAQATEQGEQRVRTVRWGPRTLDVDVLSYGDERVETADLEIPHPRMHERAFVLAPLHDVAPELVDEPADGWEGVTVTPLRLIVPRAR
jgi:2-amino-4-hydroxy-6-hydroxymethyldihydropteridine diphosphokinase